MAREVVKEADQEFRELFGRGWGMVEPYKCDDADVILVAMGTLAATFRTVVDLQREKGRRVGLLKVRLFSPFPKAEVAEILGGTRKVAVVERSFSFGHGGHLATELKAALHDAGARAPVFEFVMGLGGTDATIPLFEEALDYTYAHDYPEEGVIWKGVP
jgi:pyruvate/2-oxoacid:ferredoxin oxidoreductase alpha subunit